MKIFIPARYGSTRFPGKALAPIRGRPMVQWVWERCVKIGDSYVVTDDRRVFDCVESFARGHVIDTGNAGVNCGSDRVARAVELLVEPRVADDEVVVNVQGDQPVFDFECVEQSASALSAGLSKWGSVVACGSVFVKHAATDNPNIVKVVSDDYGRALYFSRSMVPHGARECDKHLGFYAFTGHSVRSFHGLRRGRAEAAESLEQLRMLEAGMTVVVREVRGDALAVNTPADIPLVEELV